METLELLQSLKFAWTAEIELKNGKVISIWYTSLHSIKNQIKSVIQVSSDYPMHKINTNI